MRGFAVIAVLLVLGVLAVNHWRGASVIEQHHVDEFYQHSYDAFMAQDDEDLCAMLAEDFEQVTLYRTESRQERKVVHKQDWCEANTELMEQVRRLRSSAVGRQFFDYSQTVTKVTVAPDKKSAEVEVRSTLRLAAVRISARSHDTLVRERWKTRIQHSEGTAWVGLAGR